MSTLRDLANVLGPDLAIEGPADALDREVSGVHVSELADPTAYLSGGELLLTTGMALSGHAGQAKAYAARLVAHHVAGLGFGLGPVHDRVPASLIRVCGAAGLPLFSIPAPTPFLLIARTYWSQLASAGRADLSASLDAHRELIRAVRQRDPVAAIVRVLGEAVGGWAVRLNRDGEAIEVWPKSRRGSARQLTTEIQRLRGAGPHASATFPLGPDDVVVQPLTRGSRLMGFVATCAPRPRKLPDRQLLLAACALLTLQLEQQHQAFARSRTERSSILRLVLDGYLDAARALSDELGHERLPLRARLIAIGPPPQVSAQDLVERWDRESFRAGVVWLAEDADCVWAMTSDKGATAVLADLRALTGSSSPELRAVTSPEVPLTSLMGQRRSLSWALSRQNPGDIEGPGSASPAERAAHQLEILVGYHKSDLVGAVVAYLRHRGHWERGADALGVHRHTLRQRIGTAERVTGLDLDDPDQASNLWLALRGRGLA